MVRLESISEEEPREYIDLARSASALSLVIKTRKLDDDHYLSTRGEPETGSICDIVVRDQVTLQGALHRFYSSCFGSRLKLLLRRVVLVAMNTEPLYNRQVHIGRVAMYALGPAGEVTEMELLYKNKKLFTGWNRTSM